MGCISGKGLICLLLFCKIFFKATGPRSTQSNSTKASPKGFSLEKLSSKVHQQTEGTFLLLRGGKCTELYVYICSHPPNCYCSGLCFHTNVNFERKVKGASALYCVYILKKQSFVCFYYFNYCYKKPAIFNMWFGGIFVCLFSCFGGFVCFFAFVFLGKKTCF